MTIISEDIETILNADLPWSAFAGRTVLIAGAAGFLPAYLVRTLLALNDLDHQAPTRIVALVRNPESLFRRLSLFLGREDFEVLHTDLCSPIPYDGPADFIIHAASQASPRFYLTDPVGTFNANVLGTHHLLELARSRPACTMLFVSSSEVYGQTDNIRQHETDFGYLDPTTVRACYGESKRAAETLCVAYAHQYGTRCVIVRAYHTYGPGMALDDGRVFADFVADILAGRDIVIKSDGTARRPFCYIADAIVGFLTVLLKGETATAYNVGNDRTEVSVHELAKRLVSLHPERGLRVIMDSSQRSANYATSQVSRNCPDISRLAAFGWKPHTGIEDGFRRTLTSYAEEIT